MKLPDCMKDYEYIPTTNNINKIHIPVTLLKPTTINAVVFNEILEFCQKQIVRRIELTPSGGICQKGILLLPAYSYSCSKLGAELIILTKKAYRIQFRSDIEKDEKGRGLSGTKAWLRFKTICKSQGINLDSEKYITVNGKEVSDAIEKPLICLGEHSFTDIVYSNVHHADFHSSYPAGLINTHPEFRDIIYELYEHRKESPVYKAILNYSIGMMHSRNVGWKWSQLASDAISDNNKRVLDLAKKMKESGRIILLFNTDGFWYKGDIYHDGQEGHEIGQWHNDHINCTLRIKSAGAYEFIENNQYYPIIRGVTELDKRLPRSEWKWGDIYESPIIKFYCTENGITWRKEDEVYAE